MAVSTWLNMSWTKMAETTGGCYTEGLAGRAREEFHSIQTCDPPKTRQLRDVTQRLQTLDHCVRSVSVEPWRLRPGSANGTPPVGPRARRSARRRPGRPSRGSAWRSLRHDPSSGRPGVAQRRSGGEQGRRGARGRARVGETRRRHCRRRRRRVSSAREHDVEDAVASESKADAGTAGTTAAGRGRGTATAAGEGSSGRRRRRSSSRRATRSRHSRRPRGGSG